MIELLHASQSSLAHPSSMRHGDHHAKPVATLHKPPSLPHPASHAAPK
jgi:hypothetical protein